MIPVGKVVVGAQQWRREKRDADENPEHPFSSLWSAQFREVPSTKSDQLVAGKWVALGLLFVI